MKKNLFLALGLIAALNLVACKHDDEPKEPNGDAKTDQGKNNNNNNNNDGNSDLIACSAVAAADVNNTCVKCSVDDTSILVCGVCSEADAATDSANFVKRQCISSVEGAKAFAQTLLCEAVDSKYFYVEYKSDICSDVEVCNPQKGICEEDPSLLGPCANPIFTCADENHLVMTYPDACSDQDSATDDCSDMGGCVASGSNDAECLYLKADDTCHRESADASKSLCSKTVTGVIYAHNKFADPDCPADDVKCECTEQEGVPDCSTDATTHAATCGCNAQ